MDEHENNLMKELLRKIFKILENELVFRVIVCLLHNGPVSFRSLGRKLHVNYKRLDKALKALVNVGIVEVYVVNVSPTKKYKFYSVSEKYAKILRDVI
ncbi:MAG: winged helix-turn-helix transcriptional regulator [Ignisphaera sp.]